MTHQQTLFDDERPAKIARDADPETSHAAAAEVLPKLSVLEERMESVWRHNGPLTANEAAEIAVLTEYTQSLGANAESYRKRYTGLLKRGHIVVDGTKTCRISGKTVTAYKIKEETND